MKRQIIIAELERIQKLAIDDKQYHVASILAVLIGSMLIDSEFLVSAYMAKFTKEVLLPKCDELEKQAKIKQN